jgi:hypothetical protein
MHSVQCEKEGNVKRNLIGREHLHQSASWKSKFNSYLINNLCGLNDLAIWPRELKHIPLNLCYVMQRWFDSGERGMFDKYMG